MSPRRRTVLIVSVSLVAGILLGASVFAYISAAAPPRTSEPVTVQGFFNLKAYHSNGMMFFSASGHNTLTYYAQNQIAMCALGDAKGPNGETCPGPWTSSMYVGTSAAATQLPELECPTGGYTGYGCDEASVSSSTGTAGSVGSQRTCGPTNDYCTGWNVTATFSSACADAGAFCPFTVAVVGAGIFVPSQNIGGFTSVASIDAFDQINLCSNGCQAQQVTLNKGDSLQVTIAFTVTT